MGTVAERLAQIRGRIVAAAARAARDPRGITLVGASKLQPVSRMREAWDAGLRVFGENRVQEAQAKRSQLPEAAAWHLLGPLQSNKVRAAIGLFSTFHAVDRPKIARLLDREAAERQICVDAFLEVNLGGEGSKHGFQPADLLLAATPLAALRHLRIVGLMAIPPFADDPEAMRPWFVRLRELRDAMLAAAAFRDCPGWLSMGMSHDFEIAIEEGATHVRIGTDLFGARRPETDGTQPEAARGEPLDS